MWTKEELRFMATMVWPLRAVADHTTDEFTIQREDGRQQGIFKVWAVPVIPFLAASRIEVLAALWPLLCTGAPFAEVIKALKGDAAHPLRSAACESGEIIERWRQRAAAQPVWLRRCLGRVLGYSRAVDRQLAEYFQQRPWPEGASERIVAQLRSLRLAFGLMNPFYHLEAIAGDARLVAEDLPKGAANGVALEVVPFLLVPALRDVIVAREGSWEGLTWERLREQADRLLRDLRYSRILLGVSRLAGVPPHHVLFAANAMEYIPRRVGGKTHDSIGTEDAGAQLCEHLQHLPAHEPTSSVEVLAETNALIRFLNWVPLIEGPRNFQGLDWSYACVCNLVSGLYRDIPDCPEVWEDDFSTTFCETLCPQIADLDAQSAMGRLLLQLAVVEQRIAAMPNRSLVISAGELDETEIAQLAAVSRSTGHLHSIVPPEEVGGKAFGLALATAVLGEETVPPGVIFTTGAIESLLRRDGTLWRRIVTLDEAPLNQKLEDAQAIARDVYRTVNNASQVMVAFDKYGDGSAWWAVRSSALDEGQARGIYHTSTAVPRSSVGEAIAACVASFYDREAILFRYTHHAGDLPAFAVICQPYLGGEGGVAATTDDSPPRRWRVTCGVTAESVTAGEQPSAEWRLADGQEAPDATVGEVVRLLRRLEEVFGPCQIEWVAREGGVSVLQFEAYPLHPVHLSPTEPLDVRRLEVRSATDLSTVEATLLGSESYVALDLNGVRVDTFQGELLALLARFGRRVIEVRTPGPVSPSSHFANICRHFGIRLS